MIRKAKEKDIDRILELLVQVNMVHHSIRPDLFNGPSTKYTREQLAAILADKEKPVFVMADEGDSVLGYVFCIFERKSGDNILTDITTLYIDDLCVDEKYRGQHIGKALYEYVVDFAREGGCHNITLHVWEGNDSAMAFYRKCGLKPQSTCMERIL